MNLEQLEIGRWAREVLGERSASDAKERALRVLEEALELCQAVGVHEEQANKCAGYVYARPVGDPGQEIAGILVTTYAAAVACCVDAHDELHRELLRTQQPDVIARIRERQAEKRRAFG